jgi:hypothetical protein
MLMALTTKNKLSFLNGSLSKPFDESGAECHAWIPCNTMVTSWILNSVSKDIIASVIYLIMLRMSGSISRNASHRRMGLGSTKYKSPSLLSPRMIFPSVLTLQRSKHYGMS